jgi:hypothetical protein
LKIKIIIFQPALKYDGKISKFSQHEVLKHALLPIGKDNDAGLFRQQNDFVWGKKS